MARSWISKSGRREGYIYFSDFSVENSVALPQTMHVLCIWSFHTIEWHCHQRWSHSKGKPVHLKKARSVFSQNRHTRSVFIHCSFYWRKTCHQTTSSVSSPELFIVSRDKQSLRVIHAALRCTIRLVEHFLTHSWLPPSYYDSEAQGEKKFQTSEHSSVYIWVCAGVRDTDWGLMQAFCTVFIKLCNQITKVKVALRHLPKVVSFFLLLWLFQEITVHLV